MRHPNALSSRIHLPIHSRRPDWYYPGQLFPRHRSPRHILRSCPLPLRPVYGGRIRNCCRLCPLIPSIYRLHPAQHMNKNPLRNHIRRGKLNFLPSALPRTSRNASTILRLPGCLRPMKHYVLHWVSSIPCSRYFILVHYLRSIHCQTWSLSSRIHRHKHRMTSRLSSPLSHIRTTCLCPSSK